jgi:hypothetical protein
MKKKIINHVMLLLCAFFLTGCFDRKNAKPIIPFIQQASVLAVGANFETGKAVVLNPVTGKEIQACDKPGSGKTLSQKCKTELVPDNDEQLQNAIAASQRIIKGTIIKDGKPVEARYVISVQALYKGSNCATYFSAGDQYENCVTREEECKALEAIGIPCQ